jgi:hypothetical protein
MIDDPARHGKGDDEERVEDHEAETAAAEAHAELKEELDRLTEREYQKMAADLRWEALEFIDAHPERSAVEVAEFFGLREGTIRAWKAHRTMGTYQENRTGAAGRGEEEHLPRQKRLFREPRPHQPPAGLSGV